MVLKIIIINRHSFYYKQCNSKVVSDKMKQPIYNIIIQSLLHYTFVKNIALM